MTDELTMAKADEDAQRVYAKKLAADRESQKRKRAEELPEQRESRLAAKRESEKRRRAEESKEQQGNRLEADRERKNRKRAEESKEQQGNRLEADREKKNRKRAEELPEQRESRLAAKRESEKRRRAEESQEQQEIRLAADRESKKRKRAEESQEQQEIRLAADRESKKRKRAEESEQPESYRLAFRYSPVDDYSLSRCVQIGTMSKICPYCKALKFNGETMGMCCASGKVKLPLLAAPPEPLKTFLTGTTSESKHFLSQIRKYNSCFQMTSFGAQIENPDQFMSTFKVKGQIYHRAGSLLPFSGENHKFLQLYFISDRNSELNARCEISPNVERTIVSQLQHLFHENNNLVRLFKTAINLMPTDTHKIVISADKTPPGQHVRRYNAPTIDEVAIVMVGDQFLPRDIILHKRNAQLLRIAETHRCYDALQYPIIFWDGADGYHFNIKLMNPTTNKEMNKKCSAMHYYSYRLMIRQDEENYILKCRELFHQFVVDMYAKIESERLLYIRLNQTKLRSEQYIHLRDAVINDGNTTNVGRLTILPSSYAGSPRHMHEYAQDAIAYVRLYGRPDLFITFTCNQSWDEILQLLLQGQSAVHRHDITARVFRQKLKSLINYIVKHEVFGSVRCWMYSVEWQKRGLPHAHILIWLHKKITSNEIDDVISAEIPDKNVDKGLHDIIVKNMIHGPCSALNENSPCMAKGRCTKQYPRLLVSNTITGNDGYPQYRRRSTEDGGKTAIIKKRNGTTIEVDNQWVVPYSPLLSKTFNAHINVEYCNSVKAIKYICKYVNKGSDMAVFGLQPEIKDFDKIVQYQAGRYISSNEAVWRILSFPIHERSPAVVHLAVHLQNGQRVYFSETNVQQRALNPPDTN